VNAEGQLRNRLTNHTVGEAVYPGRTRYVHLQPKAPDSPSNPGQPLGVGDTVSAVDVIGSRQQQRSFERVAPAFRSLGH